MVETRKGAHTEPEATGIHPESHQTTITRKRRTTGGKPLRRFTIRQLFTFLGLLLITISILLISAPKQVTKFVFGRSADPVEDQHAYLHQIYATELLSAAAISFALEEAARKNMLNSFTGDTLKLGLVGFSAFKAAEYVFYPLTKTPWGMALEWIVVSFAALLPASQLLFSRDDRSRLHRDFIRPAPSHIKQLFQFRKFSITAIMYTFLTVTMVVSGLSYIMLPKFTMYHGFGYVYGKSTTMLWRAIGGGHLTLMTALCYTLKEKSEDNLLSKSIARMLNMGLLATSVGHMLVFAPMLSEGHGGFLLPVVSAMWGFAMLTSMSGLSAPEFEQMAKELKEETEERRQHEE